ncbi:MAG TPA: hypothetical protein IGS52_08590 [Oscillatoriaceae cyanobacterium M33_DOE_052]|uniref:Uncharacterized protein n=1 Tax=Planktothricoides sp. SpSt-374 TaxID=2282167 RepID=A0A7C3ZW83_9CYAN|nr:hypothetical protein [Oscillatoriaceae cyanobacterium M33_DOE_052]
MFPDYIIILLIAAGSIRFFFQSSEDVASVLAVGVALTSLICGFALAPWPVQLGILLTVLVWERLYLRTQPKTKP